MSGMLGPYGMTREASGTSWQPDSTPMSGRHLMWRGWMAMMHGYWNAVYARLRRCAWHYRCVLRKYVYGNGPA